MIRYSDRDFRGEFRDLFFAEKVRMMIAASQKHPEIWFPMRGRDERLSSLFAAMDLKLFPTVLPTTVLRGEGGPGRWYIKIYHAFGWWDTLRERFSPKAKRTFNKTLHVLGRGLRTPDPLGWCVLRALGKSLLFTAEAPGESLYDMLIRNYSGHLAGTRHLLMRCAREIALAHTTGVYFRDLHLGHVYVAGDLVTFIDLDRIRLQSRVDEQEIARDLSCLNNPDLPIGTKERVLFLNTYLKERGGARVNRARLCSIMRIKSEERYRAWKGSA